MSQHILIRFHEDQKEEEEEEEEEIEWNKLVFELVLM